jgi:hypothetical protein
MYMHEYRRGPAASVLRDLLRERRRSGAGGSSVRGGVGGQERWCGMQSVFVVWVYKGGAGGDKALVAEFAPLLLEVQREFGAAAVWCT